MPLNPDKNLKLYYSIKEVAAMIGVNESTLRYWETELPQLKPKTEVLTTLISVRDQLKELKLQLDGLV